MLTPKKIGLHPVCSPNPKTMKLTLPFYPLIQGNMMIYGIK